MVCERLYGELPVVRNFKRFKYIRTFYNFFKGVFNVRECIITFFMAYIV